MAESRIVYTLILCVPTRSTQFLVANGAIYLPRPRIEDQLLSRMSATDLDATVFFHMVAIDLGEE